MTGSLTVHSLWSACVHFYDEMSDAVRAILLVFRRCPKRRRLIADAAMNLFECCSDFVVAKATYFRGRRFIAGRFMLAILIELKLLSRSYGTEGRVDGLHGGVSCRDERCFG